MPPATAPIREIGYAQNTAHGGYWWTLDDESTPELVWPNSVFVYDQMRRTDSQVASVLRAVTLPIRRTPWRIDPNGARDEVVELVATDLGLPIVGAEAPDRPMRMRDRFSWPEHLRQALLMLVFGHSYFEVTYRVDGDGNRAHLHKLSPRPAKTIERIEVARDGGLVWIKQYPAGPGGAGDSQEPIPVNRLVGYIHDREGGNWLGTSVLRAAYKNSLLKDRLLRVQAQTIERNGMGIPLYKAQEGATAADIEAGRDMATLWRAGEAAGSAVPFGADLVLRGVEGTLPDALPVVKYHDEQIARAVLAHFLNLDTQSHGSYALGSSFMDFFTLSLQTLGQQIADTATMHVIEDLVDANWGEDEPAPRLVFDEIGSRQAATAQAIKLLIDSGIITPDAVLEESERQRYGLPPADPDTARGGDEADVDADAMVSAIDAFRGGGAQPVAAAAGPDFDRLHPRGAKGRFRNTWTRILDSLTKWAAAGSKGEPLPESEFSREQLRRVAVKRPGITLPRAAKREDIRDALLDDIRRELAGKGDGPDVDEPDEKPVKKAAKKAAPKKRAPEVKPELPDGSDIEVVGNFRDLSTQQISQGDHLTPTGRRALDALGPVGHPRIAAIPDTEGKIREAYRMLAIPGGGGDHYVALADLRKLIGEQASRADVDATLIRLNRAQSDVRLVEQSYARGNFATRIPASVRFGDRQVDQIHIDDPTLSRPSEFPAVVMAEELQARRAGRDGDPMMALLSDADLRSEIDARAARDPIVARDLKAMGYAPDATPEPKKFAAKKAPARKAAPDEPSRDDESEALLRAQSTSDLRRIATALGVQLPDTATTKPAVIAAILGQVDDSLRIRGTWTMSALRRDRLSLIQEAVESTVRPKGAGDVGSAVDRIRSAIDEGGSPTAIQGRILRELNADSGLTSAKLRKVADALGIDLPDDMRHRGQMQMHIAEHAPDTTPAKKAVPSPVVEEGDEAGAAHRLSVAQYADLGLVAQGGVLGALMPGRARPLLERGLIEPDDQPGFYRITSVGRAALDAPAPPGSDFDADAVTKRLASMRSEEEVFEALDGLTVSQMRRVATALNIAFPTETNPRDLRRPGPAVSLTPDERRRHIAKVFARDRGLPGTEPAAPAATPDPLSSLRPLDPEAARDALDQVDVPGDKYGRAVRQEFDGLTAENMRERAAKLRRVANAFRGHANMTLANPGTRDQADRADAQLRAAEAADRAAEILERLTGGPEPTRGGPQRDYDALIEDAGLRGKSAAQLRRIADELNVTIPKGVTSVAARRKFLLDSVIEHGQRTGFGGGVGRIAKAVARLDAADATTPAWVPGEMGRVRGLDADAARDVLDMHTAPDLKAMLKSAGLPVSGRKRELVDRLVGHVHPGVPAASPTAPAGRPSGLPAGAGGGSRDITPDLDADEIFPAGGDRPTAVMAIIKRQGFDGQPKLTDAKGVDAVVRRGGVELFRGMSAERAVDFREGPLHISGDFQSPLGHGIYANDREVAEPFAGEGGLVRMALNPDARTVTVEELDALREQRDAGWSPAERSLYHDNGALAAALGFDAIVPSGDSRPDHYVILNRKALTVQREPAGPAGDATSPTDELLDIARRLAAGEITKAEAAKLRRGVTGATRSAPKPVPVGTRVKLKPSAGSYATSGTVTDVLPGGEGEWYVIDAYDQEGRRTQLQLPRSKFTLKRTTASAEDEEDADLDAYLATQEDDFIEPPIDPDVQREVIARLGVDLDDIDDEGEEDRILAAEFDRERLHHYWTRGKGLARWIGSPRPWTTLYRLLKRHVGSARAKRMASEWLHEVTGLWPGSDAHRVAHGGKMRGKVIGPG